MNKSRYGNSDTSSIKRKQKRAIKCGMGTVRKKLRGTSGGLFLGLNFNGQTKHFEVSEGETVGYPILHWLVRNWNFQLTDESNLNAMADAFTTDLIEGMS